MSDLMLYGVLRMPYDMAMESAISRIQFYGRVQQCADRCEAAEALVAAQIATIDTLTREKLEAEMRAFELAAKLRNMERDQAAAPVAAITEQKCKIRMSMISGNVRGVFLESYPYDIEQKTERLVDSIAYGAAPLHPLPAEQGAAPQQQAQAALSDSDLSEQQWRELCWASIRQHHMLPDGIEQRIQADVLATRQPAPEWQSIPGGLERLVLPDAAPVAAAAQGDAAPIYKEITDRKGKITGYVMTNADRMPNYTQPHIERDAARYRFLRDTPWYGSGTSLERVIAQQRNAHWDASIDAAMSAQGETGGDHG